jgi:glutamate-1-semialdehyde 2,1-aminomutase
MSAGIPEGTKRRVHVVNFNDLDSIEYVMRRYPVACVLTEPVLQNVGVVLPKPGYLQGVLDLCESYGAVCIFDEVKTGFRTALGGYQGVAGVRPHLSVFGKAVANGFPLGVIGGKREIMNQFDHPDPTRKCSLPAPTTPIPSTRRRPLPPSKSCKTPACTTDCRAEQPVVRRPGRAVCPKGIEAVVVRNASAFCVYFSREAPADLHDILTTHNFRIRRQVPPRTHQAGHLPHPAAVQAGLGKPGPHRRRH